VLHFFGTARYLRAIATTVAEYAGKLALKPCPPPARFTKAIAGWGTIAARFAPLYW
jgi:hypothetical protein